MDHFVDIVVVSDPDFPVNQLLSVVFSKLHRALVAHATTEIGVSFPGANERAPHLGSRVRLHGSLQALVALMTHDWLKGVRDHIEITLPLPVPANAKHCTVRRMQVKSSPERSRRRLVRKKGVSEQEAMVRIPDEAAQVCELPYLHLRSTSTGQNFRLFIAHGPAQPIAVTGSFNAYGLSQSATVPCF